MPTIQHETLLAAPIVDVWRFFTDPVKNLPQISPPGDAVVIESADLPLHEGSRLVIAARDPLGRRLRWESQIVELIPPRALVFGVEARFVDVQLAGPFATWRHSHEFEAVNDRTTRIVDRVDYSLPFGIVGQLANLLLVRWKINSMLRYRAKAVRQILE